MYYQKTISNTLKELKVDKSKWLTNKQIWQRIKKYWKNVITWWKKVSAIKVFLSQFNSLLVRILIWATLVSYWIWEHIDAIVILVILVLNAIFWFLQEYKAEKSIEMLKKIMTQKSRVLRNWKEMLIKSEDLTVWDILILEEWDKITADCRLIEVHNFQVSEWALTWESIPINKHTKTISKKVLLWDQKNMIFSWTVVTKWYAKAVVVFIWMDTEIWKIANMIQQTPNKMTNLQKKLNELSKWLWIWTLIICLIVFLTYWFTKELDILDAFLTSVALAVAAIPEWLPAVVTIALWLWVKRMVKKNALVRKLSSVETLWAVDIICTDKTWTLTKNEMTVQKIFTNDKIISVSGVWYSTIWKFSEKKETLKKILEIWLLCNHASLENEKIIWDPTEWALIVSAIKWWLKKEKIKKEYEYIDEIPFDSIRKMMTSIHKYADWIQLSTKWATEKILPKCKYILINWKIKNLSDKDKEKILHINEDFANNALRVLAFAFKKATLDTYKKNKKTLEKLEEWLVFVWLQAMIDPPRMEVKQSIKECHTAWIKVIMITWDNILTAKAIAKKLWIKGKAMLWIDIEKKSDIELKKLLKTVWIFARVNPSHKLRIVKILKEEWHIVAMTWDWVNDAPALKNADIWIAMWITWTDVAKQASDMILLDDNFSTIISAIEEWRGIFDNIRKFVNYLLSTNIWEVLIIFISSLLWLPLPLIAIQILLINLVTDWMPAIALWIDPISKNSMKKKPRNPKQWIITKNMILNIIIIWILMTIWVLLLFYKYFKVDLMMARSWVLMLMVLMELFRIQMIRWKYWIKIWENKWLIISVLLSILLVVAVIYTPLNVIFKTAPLSIKMRIDILVLLFWVYGLWLLSSKIINKITSD